MNGTKILVIIDGQECCGFITMERNSFHLKVVGPPILKIPPGFKITIETPKKEKK